VDLESLREQLDTDERDAAEDHTLGCSIRDAAEEDTPLTDSDLCNCPAKRRLRWVRAAREILDQYDRARASAKEYPDDFALKGAVLALHGAVRSVMSAYGDTDG
jgi:hypothetical protein